TLADNSQMWVYFNVTEAEYLDYKRRMDHHDAFAVQLRLANGEVFEQTGTVQTIEADFNNETGNIAFRATFPNPDGLLRHGETGNVVVTTPLEQVLLIPQKATFDVLDKKFVFVVDEEGVAHLREITVAEELPHLYVVGEGLTEDDRVLVEGLRKVRDGHEVATRFEAPEEVFAKLDVHAE
ncbi:MAG: efflux RND transporter periplasmic adaptor subunit, partial [Alphaproteobacteria bacterium]|nr:efflux RND transporter periplasmic adaptor subunit [Alphaproteobacteria bacterium]